MKNIIKFFVLKSNYKFLFLIALVTGVCCCLPKGDGSVAIVDVGGNKVAVLNLNELKTDVATIPLSSLVEYCNLVQLESIKGAYVDPWAVTVSDKYIGIKQPRRGPYVLFDRTGKFLCNVGSFGGGPGEYSSPIWDDIIDDENELIYLVGVFTDRIFVYHTSGQFLKEIVLPHRMLHPSIFLDNNILIVIHVPLEKQAKIFQFDVNTGELVKELVPPVHFFTKRLDGENVVLSTRNKPGFFDFHSFSNDSLYHFDLKNNRIAPIFTMPFSTSQNILKRYMLLNKDLLLTYIRCLEESGQCAGTGLVAIDLKHKTSSFVNFANDFFGNLPAPVDFYFYYLQNGYWTQSMMPEELMEEIEKRLTERGLSESDREVLKKTLSTLKEGANNVVFFGKLKDEVKTKLW